MISAVIAASSATGKSLVPAQATAMMPDLLKRLAEDITWTTNIGNAFLAQQQDVMNAVQRLRKKAKDAGKLESNDKMKVETKVVESETVVVIQPASTQVIYVPAYNPTVVWGPPVYPYPPVYYPPPPPPGPGRWPRSSSFSEPWWGWRAVSRAC